MAVGPRDERRGMGAVLPLDKWAPATASGSARQRQPAALQAVEAGWAAHDGGDAAVLVASVGAAVACTLLALLRPGDHLVASAGEGGPWDFLVHELPGLGMTATVLPSDVPDGDARAWRRAVRSGTRVLLVPCPAAPDACAALLKGPRQLARETGVALVALASSGAARPLALGADVAIRPVASEPGEPCAAVVCAPQALADEVRLKVARWGVGPSVALVAAVARVSPAPLSPA
jgi:hypothetical protein